MMQLIRRFLRQEAAGGILLMLASVLAMLLANSPLYGLYDNFLELPVAFQFGQFELRKPLLLWINDGLMAIFFLLIGLEVKREALEGALSTRQQAILPAIAAVGGMLVPALIFLLFNHADPLAVQGWAIPAATDIAFALGVLALLGSRVPLALKVFLLALAIMDDLGVIVIIALFYSGDLHWGSLLVAALAGLGMWGLNRRRETRHWPYLLLGVVMWTGVLKSGVHATLAGVITALAIPLYASPSRRHYDSDSDSVSDAEGGLGRNSYSPLKSLEHRLSPYVSFGILPLFAFANAGISLSGMSLDGLLTPLPLGVLLGLFIGKPLGIFSFSWLAIRLGVAELPQRANWHSLFGLSVLCGIGFTMSMFITGLAWEHTGEQLSDWARLGILTGSLLAACSGYLLLSRTLPQTAATHK